ncbi:MAG TPA: hypothetical protein EYP22_06695 [Methanosarcinales archaeon]|nr:hypothetical protein [Methanosarcinales archaeon]
MYKSVKMISELKTLLNKLTTYNVLMDSIVIFLLFYAILILIDTNTFYAIVFAIIPPIIYLILVFIKNRKINTILIIEQEYPCLKEKLRTTYDNIDKKNIILKNLEMQVSKRMELIKYSSFFNRKRFFSRILLCVLLALIILSATFANFKVYVLSDNFGNISNTNGKSVSVGEDAEIGAIKEIENEIGKNYDIYGAPSVAKIEGENIDLKIHPGFGSEVSVRETETKKETFSESPLFPVESEVAGSYQENIPKIHKEVVKNYFKELASSEEG